MDAIFYLVAALLYKIAGITGLTYEEINIICYYIIAPLIFIALTDKLFGFHYIKIGFVVVLIACLTFIPDLHVFSKWLFVASQNFLLAFSRIGWNYNQASVIICVLLPLLLLLVLVGLIYRDKIRDLIDKI